MGYIHTHRDKTFNNEKKPGVSLMNKFNWNNCHFKTGKPILPKYELTLLVKRYRFFSPNVCKHWPLNLTIKQNPHYQTVQNRTVPGDTTSHFFVNPVLKYKQWPRSLASNVHNFFPWHIFYKKTKPTKESLKFASILLKNNRK